MNYEFSYYAAEGDSFNILSLEDQLLVSSGFQHEDYSDWKPWFSNEYPKVINLQGKDYMVAAEKFLGEIQPPKSLDLTSNKYTIAVHIRFHNKVALTKEFKQFGEALAQNVTLKSVGKPPIRKTVFAIPPTDGGSWIIFARLVFNVDAAGSYSLENTNDKHADFKSYTVPATFKFFAEDDLKKSVTVDDQNPVAVIRVVPYTSM